MNFLCDQCKQKYHVADEKIRGRAVTRFKCKKCEHVIELRMPEGADGAADAGDSAGIPDKDLSGVTVAPSVAPPPPRPTASPARPAAPGTGTLPTRQPTGTGLPVAGAGIPRPASATGALPVRQPTGTGMSTAAARTASAPLPTRQPTGTGLPTAGALGAQRPAQPASSGIGSTAARAAATAAAPQPAAPRPSPSASPLRKSLGGPLEGGPKPSTAASALLNASETGWYAGVRDVPVGPLTRSELAIKIESGEIHADSLVWREGLDDWRPLRGVQELSELVRNAAQKMSDGLLGNMGRPSTTAPASGAGGKVVPISQARASEKPAAKSSGFGEGEEDDSPTQMHSVSDLLTSKDPKSAKAAARVTDALAPRPSTAAPAATPAPAASSPRASVPPPAPAAASRPSFAPPPPAAALAPAASATTSSKPAEAGPGSSGWSWGAPGTPGASAGAAAPSAAPLATATAPAPAAAPRPFATLNNAPVAKLPPPSDPLAMSAAPASNPLGLPSLGAPMPPPTNAMGGAAIGENTRMALGLPAPAKKGGVPTGVWILMAGMCATCLAVGLLLGTRNNTPAAVPAPVATRAAAGPTEGPTQRRVGTDIAVPTGDLPPSTAAVDPTGASVVPPPNPGETVAAAAARRAREREASSHSGSTTVASAAGSTHAPPAAAPLAPEPGPMPMAPQLATRTTTAAPPPQGPTGAERAQQILGVVNRAQAVGGCWNQATRRNPAHRNENIQVAIDVAPNGRANGVRVTGGQDADLAQCIQLRIRSTVFPPGEAVSTRASYSLSPGH